MKILKKSGCDRQIQISLWVLGLLLTILIPAMSIAQVADSPSRIEPYSWNSGSHQGNTGDQPVAQHIITSGEAIALRLHFAGVTLGSASYVTVTSLSDGHSQTLNSANIDLTANYSAFFNGDSIIVKLYAKYPDQNVAISIDQVEIEEPVIQTESICGTADNRGASNDPAVGRFNNGCTAWIIANGKIVTAGHCSENQSSSSFVEFNVPLSASGGQLQHSGPEHQYFIDLDSLAYINGGTGNDWAVFSVLNNSQTGFSALEAQGKGFHVVQSAPGNTIRITGYGVDDGSTNQTLQTHTGPLSSVTSNRVFYSIDTKGGNSGSPIIDEATGFAVGIHTHGGCNSTGGANSGTRATVGPLWDAMGLAGGPAGYTFCANEDQTCSFSGIASVAYGANGAFNYLPATNSIACNNATFGDPVPNIAKACYYQITGAGGTDITDLGGSISSQYTDSPAGEGNANLIDNNVNSKYLTFNGSGWIQYQAPSSYIVNRYTLTSANDAPDRDPLNWTLQGSNNGSTWVTIDNRSGEDFPSRFQTREFTFSNSTAYSYYRFNLNNNSGSILQLAEVELFGVAGSSGGFEQLIEAEAYTAMAGVQTETTTDVAGGLNVSWIDANDWMAYAGINFPSTGTYRVEYRVASPNGSELSLDLDAGQTVLGQLSIPATGGWQTWTTISHDVQIQAGTHDVGIFAPQGGWNINWFRITEL